MTTLITGGAGFIGSHLAETLRARGEAVVLRVRDTGAGMNPVPQLRPPPGGRSGRSLPPHAGGRPGTP